MLFNKFEDYLQHEKKFSIKYNQCLLERLKKLSVFLNQNGDKISKETNYSFIRQWIVHLSEKNSQRFRLIEKLHH